MLYILNYLARKLDTRSWLYKKVVASSFRHVAALTLNYVIILQLLLVELFSANKTRKTNSDTFINSNLTIIIKTFERPKILKRLIKSIKKYYPDIRIIVADDSLEPQEIEGIDVIFLPYDSGVCAGRSAALQLVKTKYFLSLDDDFIFYKSTDLEGALGIMIANALIGLMGGEVINLPFLRTSGPGGFIYATDKQSILPVGSQLAGLVVYDKVPQFYIGVTQKVRDIGWDTAIKRLDHASFFSRLKGHLVVVFNPKLKILHARTPFNKRYVEKRYDFTSDLVLAKSS